MESKLWLIFAALAGLCWGTYVPFVQQGIAGLGRSPFGSFLCVGLAYFLIAVLVPIILLNTTERRPEWNATGITFATLAGVAGALGALCVIYAQRNATQYDRLYIAPIIFALAPVLNTAISLIWHPSRADIFHFGLEDLPGWKLYVGILLTGAGAALVLLSKEETEHAKGPPAPGPGTEHVSPKE
jgi:drug/metabolite transporter (DMT)-like permease